MNNIKEFEERYFDEMDKLMPIVKRVHGPHHPEFYDVYDIYEDIEEKIKAGDDNLEDDFLKLREITDSYKIPDDVCETYEVMYKKLEELDKKLVKK